MTRPGPAVPLVHPRSPRVHRRGPGTPPPRDADVLCWADVVLDQGRWTVHRAGTPVELSPTEFRLLACLLRQQGGVLSKAQLLAQVWGPDFTGQPQVVETYVSYLRRKLHRLGPPLIRTYRGQGYALEQPALTSPP